MSKHHNKNKNNKYDIALTPDKTVDDETKDILKKIVSLENPSQEITDYDDLVALFNQNQSKKTMLRLLNQNKLFDKVLEQVLARFEKCPDEFSNQDLLNYMKVVQDSITNSQKTLQPQTKEVDTPLIKITQVNNTTNDTQLSKESQERIVSIVEQLLQISTSSTPTSGDIIDGEVEEIVEGDKNE